MQDQSIEHKVSPFYPGRPIPFEFFVGREDELANILRAISQVEHGKPQAIFLSGDYGIGKSSLAGYTRRVAETYHKLLGIHVILGSVKTVEEVSTRVVETALKSPIYNLSVGEKIRGVLAKYVGKQELFGISINLEALKADGPSLARGFIPFLRALLDKVKDDNIDGLFLILDEINGIASVPEFAYFIKEIWDENALIEKTVPLLLMLCGIEERRMELIRNHQPIERIFNIINIEKMTDEEMSDFFTKAFGSVGCSVSKEAMALLKRYSSGFPKIMHIIGENTFWANKDKEIDKEDALTGVIVSADEIGKKFVDQQVYKALGSKDYRSILDKIAVSKFDLSFKKSDIEKGLSAGERKKFGNFLTRMKKLNVIRSGDSPGEYVFFNRMVRLYIRLKKVFDKAEEQLAKTTSGSNT